MFLIIKQAPVDHQMCTKNLANLTVIVRFFDAQSALSNPVDQPPAKIRSSSRHALF
jgi:hypothetical protein